MNRSTRSSAKNQQHSEVEDTLMEDGFSVVDSDQKKVKDVEEGKQKNAKSPSKSKDGPAKMDVAQQQPKAAATKTATTKTATEPVVKKEEQTNGAGVGEENDAPKPDGEDGKMDVDAVGEQKDEQEQEEEGEDKKKPTEEAKTGGEDGAAGGEETKEAEGGGEENGKVGEEKQGGEDSPAPKQERKPKHPIVWVSNISRHVRASDLKKHFSKHGKVVTAKIVTNGRSFFGYVCLDSLETVDVCVKNLDDSEFDGKRISVTVDKPVRDERILRRKVVDEPSVIPGAAANSRDPLTTVYDDGAASEKRSTTTTAAATATAPAGEEQQQQQQQQRPEKKSGGSHSGGRKKVDTAKMTADELRKEVGLCEREIERLRTRLIEEQARCRAEVKRARRMERDLEDADMKIREDRKRYDRDREEWVKKNRLEQLRLDADRVIMEREKDEMRRAREDFERDLRRFIEDQHQAAMDSRPMRSISPHNPPKRFRPAPEDVGPEVVKGAPWMGEGGPGPQDKPGGYYRDSGAGQSRAGQFFSSGGGGGGWQGSQGGSQWRSIGGGGSGQPAFFKNDVYRPGGGSSGFGGADSGPGGFRSGPFDSSASRKF